MPNNLIYIDYTVDILIEFINNLPLHGMIAP
jgi:hypothetical protein